MQGKIKVLFYGDMIVPTGFFRVLHSIIKYLPKEEFQVSALGINYNGDPYDLPFKIYPAGIRGNIWGFNRIKEVLEKEDPEILFILNDVWVIAEMLKEIKDFKNIPQIITYFPVDATNFDRGWFNDYGIVTKAVVYTEFGKRVVDECNANINLSIIPHGIDNSVFFKLSKEDAKNEIYPNKPEFVESFIVLNANRNQPRKRIDVFLEAFKLFSDDKPNTKAHLHMGLRDMGWDIQKLCKRYGLLKKVAVSNPAMKMQNVSDNKLNLIYNATDLGVNSSVGEGWGLTNVEHAATGAPQIVGNHSACAELFEDCGLLIEPSLWLTSPNEGVVTGFVSAEATAEQMNKIYNDKELYATLSDKSYKKFNDPKYSWKTISNTWAEMFKEIT
jgi:glycosyltransferase involved in cell wall biosynthesis